MQIHSFRGTPRELGEQYGKALVKAIRRNLSVLVWREGYTPLPRTDKGFIAWTQTQEALIGKHWPWLLEEMHGVAQGAGCQYDDILLLNLRAWQYDYYGAPVADQACSSLAITLGDGTVAAAGALDDPAEYYCGPVRFTPATGYATLSYPITGTSWANRGMNSAGLAVGISSQILPGLRRLPHAINQDIALRAIFQTCATVVDVREFCRRHPFTLNLVCVDAAGGIFCGQNTAAGLLELPVTEGGCALTNHVADDGFRYWLMQRGVNEFPESPTTHARRGRLLEFIRERNRRCTTDEVRGFIYKRDDADPGTIHNQGTLALTYANPQADKNTCWVGGPGQPFEPVEILPKNLM